MGVVNVSFAEGREASFSRDGLRRVYKVPYLVETTSVAVSELEILVNAPLPIVGRSTYSYGGWTDPGAVCTDLSPLKLLDPSCRTIWTTTATFDSGATTYLGQSAGGGSGSSPQTGNPLFDRPVVSWGTKLVPMVIYESVEVTPKAFKNSAGKPYSDGYQMEVPLRTLTIVRHEAHFDPWNMWGFENTVNQFPFQRQSPKMALCQTIDSSTVARDGIQFNQVTYTFLFADDHLAKFLDKGDFYLEPLGSGEFGPRNATTSTGQTREILLDGEGGKLPDGASPRFLGFVTKYDNDFGELHLPDPAWF